MSTSLLVDETPLLIRVAEVDEEGRAVRLLHAFPRRAYPLVGSLWRAKVTTIDKRLGAAFLDLGVGGPGFLRRSGPLPSVGQTLIVEVRREPIGDKGVDVSDRPRLRLPTVNRAIGPAGVDPAEDRHGPLGGEPLVPEGHALPIDGEGPGPADPLGPAARLLTTLLRPGIDAVDVTTADTLVALKPWLADQVPLNLCDPVEAARFLSAAEDEAMDTTHRLGGGGQLVIDEGEALTAIDVDLGSGGGQSKKGAGTKLIGDALGALGRLAPLAGLGGQIIIDVPRGAIAAPKIVRDQVTRALKPLGRLSIPAVTPDGLVVVVAPRPRASVLDRLTVTATSDAPGTVRPARVLAPDVAAARALEGAAEALAADRTRTFTLSIEASKDSSQARFFDKVALAPLLQRYGNRLTVEPA